MFSLFLILNIENKVTIFYLQKKNYFGGQFPQQKPFCDWAGGKKYLSWRVPAERRGVLSVMVNYVKDPIT